MWDRNSKKEFNLSLNFSDDKFWFKSVYPIWITAEDNYIKTGICFWPGSEVSYSNKRPTKYRKYQKDANFTEMINNITHSLIYEDIDFGLMYFNQPDYTSHRFGPFSHKTITKVQEMDQHVGYIMNILNSSPIKDKINVIFLSDHGMSEPNIVVNVSFPNDITHLIEKITDETPLLGIFAKSNYKEILYSKIKEYFRFTQNVNIYLKENFPKKYHYSNNERVPDILILAKENVTFLQKSDYKVYKVYKGVHGYSNEDSSMNSFLVAQGPDITKSMLSPTNSIDQVDIYHLMCALLKMYPKPNNGSLNAVKKFLVDDAVKDYVELLNSKRGSAVKINTLVVVHMFMVILFDKIFNYV